jgi:hypothetical protein
MKNSILALPATLAAILSLTACNPDDPSASTSGSGVPTPSEVESKLKSLEQDLTRVLAVVEPLQGDPEAQRQHLVEDDQFAGLIGDHVVEFESLATALQSMTDEEKQEYTGTIGPVIDSLEQRMKEICSCGPVAEDALAPLFAAAQDALKASL